MVAKYPLALFSSVFWIGAVCAISFLEAWLKFKAPGVTLPIGLGIGRLVFGALNKIEWVLAAIVLLNFIFSPGSFYLRWQHNLIFIIIAILILQSFWLLPSLDERAGQLIAGNEIPHSYLHFYFVGLELTKVIILGFFAITLFKTVKP